MATFERPGRGIPLAMTSEVVDAVIALMRTSGQTYEQYIAQVAGNAIARPVKLADLAGQASF